MPSPLARRAAVAVPGATIAAMSESSHGTVLVVDDEATILDVVGRYMERAGYETHRAADGRRCGSPTCTPPIWSSST